jgi:hypothetical protein
MNNRKDKINEILKELNSLRDKSVKQYAVEENITFFQAAKTVSGYIRWLMARAGKIDKKEHNKLHVILCKNDIFRLDNHFPEKTFDIIYHSLFKHHLNDRETFLMDTIVKRLSKYVLEYDGYRSGLTLIPQTITAWNHPVFLNAAILSNFRFSTKKELKTAASKTSQLCFYKAGTYLLSNQTQTQK